ncbi:hypothetical protein JVU11DRAFT_2595 [Chiua virens]|nr:hypothetical protein JVU11DRAFT_2595 [Chiua virens]
MPKRYDVQRQHVVDSLDNLIFQLYILSFFLSPTILPLVCRVATQFVFYKPRELDPKLSLRVWLFFLCLANAPSFWFHVQEGATEGRAIILDFIGMGYLPSKLHLVSLDTLILSLQMLLTTISFEISLHLSSSSETECSIIPLPSALSPPILEVDCADGEGKYSHRHAPTMIIDLRFRHLINRLRNPVLPVSPTGLSTLPLPNTTPSPLSMHLRAIVRRREEARRRASDQSDSAGVTNSARTEDMGRMPGSMTTEQVE